MKNVPSIFYFFLDNFFFFNELFTGNPTFYNRHFDNFKYKFSQNHLDFSEMETSWNISWTFSSSGFKWSI